MPPAAATPAASTDVIRPAEPRDVDAITAIYAHAVATGTATFETEAPDAAEMLSRFARLTGGGFPYLVAGPPSGILGYAYAGAYRERSAYRFTVEDSIYVRHDQRGKGIGRALLDAIVEDATARGFRQMVAVIGDSANAGSIRLHATAGFAHIGVLASTGWKHARWLDVVLMQRALGDGDGYDPAT